LLDQVEIAADLKRRGIDTQYQRDKTAFWLILRRFVTGYLQYYYDTILDVIMDPQIMAFVRQFVNGLETDSVKGQQSRRVYSIFHDTTDMRSLGEKQRQRLYDCVVDGICQLCDAVTGGHEQVGAVEAYVQDASFCAFKWTPGALVATKQGALATALLMSFTSSPMPKLLGSDWTHLFPPRPDARPGVLTPVQVFRRFQSELTELSMEIDKRNASASSRPFPDNFPLYVYNPRLLETSISV